MSDQKREKIDNLKLIQLEWDTTQFSERCYFVSASNAPEVIDVITIFQSISFLQLLIPDRHLLCCLK